jgi:hypothetical protein
MPGTPFKQQNSRAAKVTSTQVYDIRRRYAEGETQASLAREYKLSVNQIGRIVRGEAWGQFANPVEGTERELYRQPTVTDNEIEASLRRVQEQLLGNEPIVEVLKHPDNPVIQFDEAVEEPEPPLLQKLKQDIQAVKQGDKNAEELLKELEGKK